MPRSFDFNLVPARRGDKIRRISLSLDQRTFTPQNGITIYLNFIKKITDYFSIYRVEFSRAKPYRYGVVVIALLVFRLVVGKNPENIVTRLLG